MQAPRVAVFPVAGLGTRFLPFTKSVPKELLPLNGRPVIEYAVSEARKAGFERFVFVSSRSKPQLEAHFQAMPDLETKLDETGKTAQLARVRDGDLKDDLRVVHQEEALGLGHAVLCARELVNGEPFAVLLPDDFIHNDPTCLEQMMHAYRRRPGNYLATHDVGFDAIHNYGCLEISNADGKVMALSGMVEKPDPMDAPSSYAIVGRYILQPAVMEALAVAKPTVNGEIQLTDAIAAQPDLFAYAFEGEHFDCGQPSGFASANSYVTFKSHMPKVLRRQSFSPRSSAGVPAGAV